MAETKTALRKPVFTKVDQLRQGTSGHNLIVKVVSSKMVVQKGRPDGPQARQLRISEFLVGDETGANLILLCRNVGCYEYHNRCSDQSISSRWRRPKQKYSNTIGLFSCNF